MKKHAFLVLLLIGITLINLKAQTIADTLDMAYASFGKKDYKSSAEYFDNFLFKVHGEFEDYYLAGVCHAQLNNEEKCLNYINKAAENIADYQMVLNDSNLTLIHDDVKEIIHTINQFNNNCIKLKNTYRKEQLNILNTLDSIYHLLPESSVSQKDLQNIAWKFNSQKDTTRFIYFLDQAYSNAGLNKNREYISNTIERQVTGFASKLSDKSLDQLSEIETFRYFYSTMRFRSSDSSKLRKLEITFDLYIKLLPQKQYQRTIDYIIAGKGYDFAYNMLYYGLASKRITLEDVFKIKSINKFLEQPVGKSFLTLIFSQQLFPTIENADKIIIASSYESHSSNREHHNYLQAKDFNAPLPSLKKFLIKERVFGNIDNKKEFLVVGKKYPYGLYEDEFEVQLDTSGSIKLLEKDFGRFFNPKDQLILLKGIKNNGYTEAAGQYYLHPVTNLPYILAVKNRKITKSSIPAIRKDYFDPLIPFALPYYFKPNIERDDARYPVYKYGYDRVINYLLKKMKSVNKEELNSFLLFIEQIGLRHTSVFDFLIATLNNFEKYALADEKLNRSNLNLLNKIAHKNIRNIESRQQYVLPFEEHKSSKDNFGKEEWSKSADLLTEWWENYKNKNPFELPRFVKSTISEIKSVPKEYSTFFLNSLNQPVFRNPENNLFYSDVKKTVEIEAEAEEEISIMTEDEETEYPAKINKRTIEGRIIGNTGYLFSPTEKDKPDEILLIPELSEHELTELQKAYSELGLSERGTNLIGGYEKSYDRFYVYRFNKKLVVGWFDNLQLRASFLTNEKPLFRITNLLHEAKEYSCANNKTVYKELPVNLHSFNFETLDNKLLAMYNIETKQEPKCETRISSRIYLKLLDEKLHTITEHALPTNDSINLGKNSDSRFIVTNNHIYVFIQVKEEKGQLYCALFDKNLKQVKPLFKVNSKENNISGSFELAYKNNDVYCFYTISHGSDILLAMSKIGASGVLSEPKYIYHSEGTIKQMNGYLDKKNYTLYFSEKAFKTTKTKKITIPLNKLK